MADDLRCEYDPFLSQTGTRRSSDPQAIEDARTQRRKGLVLTCKEALIHYYASFGFENEGISESVHGNVTWYQMRLTFPEK